MHDTARFGMQMETIGDAYLCATNVVRDQARPLDTYLRFSCERGHGHALGSL
jgi:hypothetical protein